MTPPVDEELFAQFADNPRVLAWLKEAEEEQGARKSHLPLDERARRDPGSRPANADEPVSGEGRSARPESRAARARARQLALSVQQYDMRRLATYVKLWDSCGRHVCRKARACRCREASCFDDLRDTIVERLEQMLAWERLTEGPPDAERLDEMVDDLRRRGAPL